MTLTPEQAVAFAARVREIAEASIDDRDLCTRLMTDWVWSQPADVRGPRLTTFTAVALALTADLIRRHNPVPPGGIWQAVPDTTAPSEVTVSLMLTAHLNRDARLAHDIHIAAITAGGGRALAEIAGEAMATYAAEIECERNRRRR
jgi:hypothetical protein